LKSDRADAIGSVDSLDMRTRGMNMARKRNLAICERMEKDRGKEGILREEC